MIADSSEASSLLLAEGSRATSTTLSIDDSYATEISSAVTAGSSVSTAISVEMPNDLLSYVMSELLAGATDVTNSNTGSTLTAENSSLLSLISSVGNGDTHDSYLSNTDSLTTSAGTAASTASSMGLSAGTQASQNTSSLLSIATSTGDTINQLFSKVKQNHA
jgi:hypothetical protein